MDLVALDAALLHYTGSTADLASLVHRYARAVRAAASVVEVEITGPQLAPDGAGLTGTVQADPEVPVGWSPPTGWYFCTEQGWPCYRVAQEADAAGIVPAPEIVAAWLHVLASGDRSGHPVPPEALAAEDPALLELLVTGGAGTTAAPN